MSREIKSATDLENAFAQVLNKSAREVVRVFDFYLEGDVIVARKVPDADFYEDDWKKIHALVKETRGRIERDDHGIWYYRFPKAAALSEANRSKDPQALPEVPLEAPNGPGHGEAAAAGQPTNVHNVDKVDNVANVTEVTNVAETPAPSPKEWKPEYPAKDAPVTSGYYAEFPVDRILSPSFTFRQAVGEGIEALMAEIHAAGMIIEPIIARPAKTLGHVEIGPGERRLLAARQLGMKTVPLIVREMADVEFDRVRLLENLARKDLTDLDLAHILQYLMQMYPTEYPTQEALAQAFGKDPGWVSRHLSMLEIENMSILPRGNLEKMTERQAREIISTPPEKRAEVAEKIAEHIEKEGEAPSAREIRSIARPGEGQRVKCARCGTPTYKPVEVDGQQYCQVCSAVVKSAPKKTESVPKPPMVREAGFEPATPSEDVIKEHEEPKQVDKGPIDTGMKMICPICNREFMVIHSEGKHRLDPIMVMEK